MPPLVFTVNPAYAASSVAVRTGEPLISGPTIWFNADTTEGGRDALGWYHEKKDEERSIGLGPEHDWSSHSSDAFGLMCVAYEEPKAKGNEPAFVPRRVV